MGRYLIPLVLALKLVCALPALAEQRDFQCRECHSKNPKLVRMHAALGYKDCMLCHDPATFKFDRSASLNTPTPEQKDRMAASPICRRCHIPQPASR